MRQLFDRMSDAVATLREKYLRPDGTSFWPPEAEIQRGVIDGLDDVYEGFHTWPLAYLLGADARLLEWGWEGFEATTRQFAAIPTGRGHSVIVNEYEQSYDWFHQGEGYQLFYHLCSAKPSDELLQTRAGRFSGLLRNEEVPTPNFDSRMGQFLSPHIGSTGAGMENFPLLRDVFLSTIKHFGLPFQKFPALSDPATYFSHAAHREEFGRLAVERLSRGDVPANLAATSMAFNATNLTGDRRHADWALEYIDRWMRRAEANGGLIPDNVGPSGQVGECLEGDWFGGHYGWTWPHGWHSLGMAVAIAMQNAFQWTGDPQYPAFLRQHLERLGDLAIEVDGTLHLPHKHGHPGWYGYDTNIPMLSQVLKDSEGQVLQRDGWFEFYPQNPVLPVALWEMTRVPDDENLLLRLRNHRPSSWHTDAWKTVRPAPSKALGGHEAAWVAYLRGEFFDYPERILEHNHAQMDERLALMETDDQPRETYGDAYLQRRNPISLEGIFQLTTGAALPLYNGGLPQTLLRHFDAANHRPGLPSDTAVLVEKVELNAVCLRIVNLHAEQPRHIIIQAGFYAEHEFTSCKIDGRSISAALPARHLRLELAPRCNSALQIGLRRHCHCPQHFADAFRF